MLIVAFLAIFILFFICLNQYYANYYSIFDKTLVILNQHFMHNISFSKLNQRKNNRLAYLKNRNSIVAIINIEICLPEFNFHQYNNQMQKIKNKIHK